MARVPSKQERFDTTQDVASSWIFSLWETYASECPGWGALGQLAIRTQKLREYAQAEPILAGALSSMVSKAVSLGWQITGGRNRVRRYHEILSEAEDGLGWSMFLDRWAQDYFNCDLGGVAELAREGKNGPVVALFNLDAGRLHLTGNHQVPLRYTDSIKNRTIPLRALDFMRIVDMPAPDEAKHALGFCAVSRALKAARVLMALYNYEEEQLADLPPKGLAAITGMTQPEVKAAFDRYEQSRKSKEQLAFKGVLWLAAQASALNPIDIKLVPFSTLPDHFNKETSITLYVYTLSLDFGVDVREFWPASQTGATKAEAEVQAQKAKGKGFGRFLQSVERAINWDVLPDGLEFLFDQADGEDDLLKATVHARIIENVRRLWEPSQFTGQGIIGLLDAKRMLVEAGAVPDWLAITDETTAEDTENVVEEEETTGEALDQAVDELAQKARLSPGEDLISIDRAGQVVVIKSHRRYSIPGRIAVANWPGLGVPGTGPFVGTDTARRRYGL